MWLGYLCRTYHTSVSPPMTQDPTSLPGKTGKPAKSDTSKDSPDTGDQAAAKPAQTPYQKPEMGAFDYLDVAFTGSYPRLEDCPKPAYPEYAFIGRSNVGKSSLVNLLTGRKQLAKVSGRPGKTQQLNYFWVSEGWYIVDLPGYGYAKVSKTQRANWEKLIRNFMIRRGNLATVFLLIDGSIPPQQSDLDFADYLGECRVPWVLVYTKTDRISPTKRKILRQAFEDRLKEHWDALPPAFITSASKGHGRVELMRYISEINATLVGKK